MNFFQASKVCVSKHMEVFTNVSELLGATNTRRSAHVAEELLSVVYSTMHGLIL